MNGKTSIVIGLLFTIIFSQAVSASSAGYIWQPVEHGTLQAPQPWNYIMGYQFTPQEDRQITELCAYFNGGATKTVKLWDISRTELASTTVSSSDNWACSSISPVDVTASSSYYVGVCLQGTGGRYRNGVTLPTTSNGVDITNSFYYSTSGCTLAGTPSTTSSYMYGMADAYIRSSLPVVTKDAPANAILGQNITYNITYTNYMDTNITNVTIYDFLPTTNVTYVSNTCGGSVTGGVLTATIGNMSNGSSGYCEINVTIHTNATEGANITNNLNLSYINSTGSAFNISASAQTLLALPSINVSKTAPSTASLGEEITYTINYDNNGSVTAYNISIWDYLPSNVTYVSNTCGGTNISGVVNISIGTLAASASGSCKINVTVNSNAQENVSLINYMNLSAASLGGQTLWFNTSASTLLPYPQMTLSKAAICIANVNDMVYYNITYKNTGSVVAKNVNLTDTLPTGVDYVSDDCGGSNSSGVVTVNLGDISSGAGGTCNITAKITGSATSPITNLATITYGSLGGATLSTNTSAATEIGSAAYDVIVDDDGAADYTTISNAIGNATAGDTVFVCRGSYSESNTVSKSLSLIGQTVGGTTDVIGTFTVSADNVTIKNFDIDGGDHAIKVKNYDDLSVINNTLHDTSKAGIQFRDSTGGRIINNTIYDSGSSNGNGIEVKNGYALIEGNNISDSQDNGIKVKEGSGLTIRNNIIYNNGKSSGDYGNAIALLELGAGSWMNITNNTLYDNGDFGIAMGLPSSVTSTYCAETMVWNNNISYNLDDGIYLNSCNGSTIKDNLVTGNVDDGIYLYYSNSNTLSGNNASSNGDDGIDLDHSHWNTISKNNASNNTNEDGISIWDSVNNVVTGNTIMSNLYGIYLLRSNGTTITNNNASENNRSGINLTSSFNNSIYNNYFSKNFGTTINAWDDGTNSWNTTVRVGTNIVGGLCMGGNYWSDYAGRDINADGFGSEFLPYNSSGNITSGGDYLPLMLPPASFYNLSAIENGTSEVVMTTGCPAEVVLEITTNTTGNATVELLGQVSPDEGTFGLLPINSNTSDADSGVKYLNVTNSTGLDNVTRIRIEVHYTNAEIAGLDENTLALYYWNGSSWLNTLKYKGTNMTPTGPTVYDAGRKPAQNYVYAVVDHFSNYGVGGNMATPTTGGGLGPGIPPSSDILVVANSIDSELAQGFFQTLKDNRITAVVINATEFTPSIQKNTRLIVVLGGPDAPDGIGEIVRDVLSDSEEAAIRAAGSQQMIVKYNTYTDRYTYGQMVIVIAGSDRANTKAAEIKYSAEVEHKLVT